MPAVRFTCYSEDETLQDEACVWCNVRPQGIRSACATQASLVSSFSAGHGMGLHVRDVHRMEMVCICSAPTVPRGVTQRRAVPPTGGGYV